MDNVTHSLFALTIAQTRLRQAGPGTTVALLIASNAPDLDIVTAFTDGVPGYLAMHRGPTHGPIGVLALGLATAAVIRLCVRGALLGRIAAVAIFGALLHILMDFPTSYGTRLLSPFISSWLALDLMPIIDIYLIGTLGIAVLGSRLYPRYAARMATVALLAMGANYAARAVLHDRVLMRAAGTDPACDGRFLARWPGDGSRAVRDHPCVAALPGFRSPLEWRVIRYEPGLYSAEDVHVLQGERGPPVVMRDEWNEWVAQARRSRVARIFLGFARFPIASVERNSPNAVTVRWNDVRFAGGLPRLGERVRDARSRLSVFVTLDPQGRITNEGPGAQVRDQGATRATTEE